MLVTIVGAHGQIARLLTRNLRSAGHNVRGIVRSQRQFGDIRADGAQPVLCDLESSTPAELDAAVRTDARRFVMVSAMGTDDPPQDDSTFSVYLRAKAAADDHARAADIPATIVRPGRLTDEEPTGRVTLARHVAAGEISRVDVAAVVCELITTGLGPDATIEVVEGATPIAAAVTAIAGMRPATLR